MSRLALTLIACLAAGAAFAQSAQAPVPQTSPRTEASRQALLKAPAPEPATHAIDGNMMAQALDMVCRTTIERSAVQNRSFARGRDIVPDAAAEYLQQMRSYQDFACPCMVKSLSAQFDLGKQTPEQVVRIRPAIAVAMTQTCSKDVWAQTLTAK